MDINIIKVYSGLAFRPPHFWLLQHTSVLKIPQSTDPADIITLRPEGAENIPFGLQVSDLCF